MFSGYNQSRKYDKDNRKITKYIETKQHTSK